MKVKIGNKWHESTPDKPIMVEFSDEDKDRITNMHPFDKKYVEFHSKDDSSLEDKLEWMERESNYVPLGLTVKRLRERLQGVPDNAFVYYQRIEDKYFEKFKWTTKEFIWDGPSNYIKAWDCVHLENENVFIIDAHY